MTQQHGKVVKETPLPPHAPHPDATPEQVIAKVEQLFPGAIEAMANAE